jgi:site-specific recombinase XerD
MTEMAIAVEEYVRSRRGGLHGKPLSKETAAGYRSYLIAFADTYGDRPIKSLRPLHVTKFLATRAHLAESTQRTDFSQLRRFCRWLALRKMVPVDPIVAGDIHPPAQPDRLPRAMVPDAVADTFSLGAPDRRGRAIIALAVGCGLRCCEISSVKIEDWRRHDNMMRVTGKRKHERWVAVPEEVEECLMAYLAEYPVKTGQPIIRSYNIGWKPLAPSTISKYVAEWMYAAGVKVSARDGVSAHALRHTAATDVLESCGDLQVVQLMLGHKQLSTTAIYLGERNAKEKLKGAMGGRSYRRRAAP